MAIARLAAASACSRLPDCKLLLAELHHGIERQPFQPLPLAAEPFGPGFLGDVHIGEKTVLVEVDRPRRAKSRLPSRISASNRAASQSIDAGRKRDFLAIADQDILAQHPAQPEQGLAQVLPGLGLEMRAPEQRCQLLARLRLGRGAGQVCQQAGELLAGQVDGPVRPGQLEAAQQRKPEFRERYVVHRCARAIRTSTPFLAGHSAFFTAARARLTPW